MVVDMNTDPIQAELEAYASIATVLEQAKKCQDLHARAGLPLPERIQRLLGLITDSGKAGTQRSVAQIPEPQRKKPPKDAGQDWISIVAGGAIVTTVALAILREAGGEPLRSRDLGDRVISILPDATTGSLANAGTRLAAEGVIERTDEGWKLLKPERAAVLQDGLLWGPVSIFGKQEIAAHRREAILHVLKYFPTGLQIVQIVERLNECPWVHAPANKDILKLDTQVLLADRKIKRVGNTKKWQLAPADKGE